MESERFATIRELPFDNGQSRNRSAWVISPTSSCSQKAETMGPTNCREAANRFALAAPEADFERLFRRFEQSLIYFVFRDALVARKINRAAHFPCDSSRKSKKLGRGEFFDSINVRFKLIPFSKFKTVAHVSPLILKLNL